jgi:hypothetical protein
LEFVVKRYLNNIRAGAPEATESVKNIMDEVLFNLGIFIKAVIYK